jgi:hypothetical protein
VWQGRRTVVDDLFGRPRVLLILIAMLVILALAGLVLVFAAFPHRGETVPGVPWLGDAMERAADAAPVIEPGEENAWTPRP